MKRIVSAVLAGAMALSLAACGGASSTAASSTASSASAGSAAASAVSDADSDLAYIQSNGKMVIGYTVYEPMNYTDADGNFTGFDTELATAVCEKLGVEPEFVEINWDTKETELAAKCIDLSAFPARFCSTVSSCSGHWCSPCRWGWWWRLAP